MEDRELNQKLESVELPRVTLPGAKARLRRELLTSPHFEQRAGRMSIYRRVRYALAALATIAVAAVIAIQFIPERLSAKVLIDNMEAAYDSRVVSGAVHYLRQALTIPGAPSLEVERWVHPDGDNIRIRLRNGSNGDVLAHSIVEGSRTYGLASGTGPVHGEIRRVKPAPDKTGPSGNAMAIVISPLHHDREWTDETTVQALVMEYGFDRDQFAAKTPRSVVSDLARSSDVIYAGVALEPQLDQKIEILERRNSAALPFKLELPARHLGKVQEFLELIISQEISLEIGDQFAEFLETNNLEGEVKISPTESVETVEVFAESSLIHRVTLTVSERGVETYRVEKTFLEDRYLSYSPDMFDPEHHGLTMIPDTDERSTK